MTWQNTIQAKKDRQCDEETSDQKAKTKQWSLVDTRLGDTFFRFCPQFLICWDCFKYLPRKKLHFAMKFLKMKKLNWEKSEKNISLDLDSVLIAVVSSCSDELKFTTKVNFNHYDDVFSGRCNGSVVAQVIPPLPAMVVYKRYLNNNTLSLLTIVIIIKIFLNKLLWQYAWFLSLSCLKSNQQCYSPVFWRRQSILASSIAFLSESLSASRCFSIHAAHSGYWQNWHACNSALTWHPLHFAKMTGVDAAVVDCAVWFFPFLRGISMIVCVVSTVHRIPQMSNTCLNYEER
jgi:hypothetical protein